MAAATKPAAKPATANKAAAVTLTNDLFMSSTLGSQSGAEAMPFGLYALVNGEDGRPQLLGAKYNDEGNIERELYDAPGQSYDKKPRAAYLHARNNETGNKFRLGAKALQDAIKVTSGDKTVTIEDVAEGIELQQTVKENANGHRVAEVSFEPGE